MAEIDWTEQALEDIEAIAGYIALNSEKSAAFFVQRAFERVGQLEKFPRSGRMVPEVGVDDLRELILNRRYRMVYQLASADKLNILTVHDGRLPLSPSIFTP